MMHAGSQHADIPEVDDADLVMVPPDDIKKIMDKIGSGDRHRNIGSCCTDLAWEQCVLALLVYAGLSHCTDHDADCRQTASSRAGEMACRAKL